jgi:outer membrane protein assembly factor BamB
MGPGGSPVRKFFFPIACCLAMNLAWAKRLPPPVLPPVDDGAYRFVVFNEPGDHHQNPCWEGHVAAYLKATGEKIWDKYLYRVWIDPAKSSNDQDVYLKKMYLDPPNQLILQNEQGIWFVLERHTGDFLKIGRFKKQPDDPSVYYVDGSRVEPVLKGDYYIEADSGVSYGHQKVRAYDLPTGKLLWEKKVPSPPDGNGGRSHISFMVLNDKDELEITFDDGSESRIDMRKGKLLKTTAER